MASFDPPLYYFDGINFNSGYFGTGNTTTSTASGNYLPLTGGTLSGTLNGTSINATTINSTTLQENNVDLSTKYLGKAGGTMTGTLTGTTINATSFVEGGTALSSKYLGLGGGTVVGRIDATILNGTAISENFIDLQYKYLALGGGTLTGALTGTTINATSFVEGGTALSSKYLALGGGTLTGTLTGTTINATSFVEGATALSSKYLAIAGGTMTGGLIISAGNVGIGTIIPTEKVDIVGNLKTSGSITSTSFVEGGTALSSKYLALGGGTLTGALTGTTINATSFVEGGTALSSKYLALGGGTLTGALTGTTINATSFVEGGTALSSKYLALGGGTLTGALTGTTINATSFVEGGTALSSKYLPLAGGTITNNVFFNGGIVGIGTTSATASSLLTIGNIPVDRASYNLASAPTTITHQTPSSTVNINDPQPVINICRLGVTTTIYGPRATLKICRWENNGAFSRSRLDISLAHGNYDDINIISFRSDGKVGINQLTPTSALDVVGDIKASTTINALTNLQENSVNLSSKYLALSGGTMTGILNVNTNTGTTGVLGAHVRADIGGYSSASGVTYNDVCASFASSVWCKYQIIVSSDERIKRNIQDINDDSALQKILSIQPKTYNYIDISRGTSNIYGFIAQQIKEVIPEAVSIQKEYIPDIYDIATYSSNIITTSNIDISNILNSSNLVKIYDDTGKEYKCKVNEILSSNSFKIDDTDLNINSSNVFLYGKEINDFNALDKSYIYTLNVCATQNLYEIIQELKSTITTLENRISVLENR